MNELSYNLFKIFLNYYLTTICEKINKTVENREVDEEDTGMS